MTARHASLAPLVVALIVLTYAYAETGSWLAGFLMGAVIYCGARTTRALRRKA